MFGKFGKAAIATASFCLVAGSALAQFPPITDPTKDEAKCQKSTGSALVKFTGSKTKCISKCISTARKTMGPYTGCFGPAFTDPVTNTCITDPVKGAEAKAAAAIVKACQDAPPKDKCPECFNPNTCTDNSNSNPRVVQTEGQIDPFGNLIYCAEVGGNTPTKEEAKCEDTVVKTLVKFVGSKTKCYQKCEDNMLKGKIAPGSCSPPTPGDAATQTCINNAEAKSIAGIDKACEAPGVKPACYGSTTGTGWTALVESNVDFAVPLTACGSPSGAFID